MSPLKQSICLVLCMTVIMTHTLMAENTERSGCPAGKQVKWTVYEEQDSWGDDIRQFPEVTTVEGCQAACLNTPDCVAATVNNIPGNPSIGCWVKYVYLPEKVSPKESHTYMAYTCVNSDTESSGCPAGKEVKWTVYYEQDSWGNDIRQFPEVTTVEGCQAACLDTPKCVAATVNNIPGNPSIGCWVKYVYLPEKISPTSRHTHMAFSCINSDTERSGCPAGKQVKWNVYYEQDSWGNDIRQFPEVTTAEGCQAACLNTPNCVAATVNNIPGNPSIGCWVKYVYLPEKISPTSGHTHMAYTCINSETERSACPAGKQVKWSVFYEQDSWGNDIRQFPEVTTVEGCQAACLDTPNCVAATVNNIPGNPSIGCWVKYVYLLEKISPKEGHTYMAYRCVSCG